MDVVIVILKPVVETLMVPVKKHIGYLIGCTKYVRDMGTKMMELNVARHAEEDHLDRNTRTRLEISSEVRGWLEEVEKIDVKVKNVPSDVGTCCSLKIRHTIGRKAFKIIEEIESVTRQHSLIRWTDNPIPLGKVDSMKASSAPSNDHHQDFQSRQHTFAEALKALELNQKSHMVALWGMGGVGKTTMMQRLKKVVQEEKMFNFIVEAVIGEKTDPIAIQDAIADYLGIELKEKTKQARADKLRERFVANSEGGKKKFLVILDDVWQFVDLNDIGLSHLPNQGIDFKVLLTSRNRHICANMGVEASSIINVKALSETEAQSFFYQFVQTADPELHRIGEDIVSKCCGLPIIIKTIALTLRNKSTDAWKDAFSRLQHHELEEVVNKVFEISYNNLHDDDSKSILWICGLFPEDFDIPKEELVRCGWGLKLFKRKDSIREARYRLNTCIERLMDSNLLIKSDDIECVKLHDLVRAFILHMFSKADHASIVNHGSMSGWPENDMNDSCKGISLNCKGMSEFPRDLTFPNLSILKLMHGDKSLRFPLDFYGEMKKLEVIFYDNMKYPFLPSSPHDSSSNLRVLHLHKCSLMMFDCSSIGNMLNLEVLSFANSGIEWLPSTIGNLKKLRLLDLTNCASLRVDNGVLKNLVKLEELYALATDNDKNVISFTNENCNEIEERSQNLSSFEFQFFRNNAQPKNMSFENLERFKISVGCSFNGSYSKNENSAENTLQLVTNISELLDSRLNELFVKTEILYLEVPDMNDIGDVEVNSLHSPQTCMFKNLRVLIVWRCDELRCLFTFGVARNFSNLENLQVYECHNMGELICIENRAEETITFPKLKFLSLEWMNELSGLCHNANIIELPQLVELKLTRLRKITSIYSENKLATYCLFKGDQVVVPKLEKLFIGFLPNLKEIWPREFSISEEVELREIEVTSCHNLVNMFPCNPMPLLHHLEDLEIRQCDSIEVLFFIDLDRAAGVGEKCGSSSNLKTISAYSLGGLREVWRIKGENNSAVNIRSFQSVEIISIKKCKRFINVFTSTYTTNFDLGASTKISIDACGGARGPFNNSEGISQEEKQEINIVSKQEIVTDSTSNVVHSFHNLRELTLREHYGLEVAFEIETPTSREAVTHQPQFPYLERLHIWSLQRITHVWKCNWNKYRFIQKLQSESTFSNLRTIYIDSCDNIIYLFSPLMAKLLSNLREVDIRNCEGIEEVVSNRDDEDEENTTSTSTHTNTTLFPYLDKIHLHDLKTLKYIGGGGGGGAKQRSNDLSSDINQYKSFRVGGVWWTLCQYSREISLWYCHALSSVIPCYAVGEMQKLQVLVIYSCNGMKEVFETQEINTTNNNSDCDEGNGGTNTIMGIPELKLPNLKTLNIKNCALLEYVLPFSALESLKQLEVLKIRNCKAMKVIVKEEHDHPEQTTTSKEIVVFPRLKSIELRNLPELVGFFLGMNHEFRCPSLDEVTIGNCPQIMVFARGGSTAPRLKYIHTSSGQHSLGESGLNFYVTTAAQQQDQIPSLSSSPPTSEVMPWSFHNLITVDIDSDTYIETVIPFSGLLQLQKLEKIHVRYCALVQSIFEELEMTDNSFDESQTLVELPNLREVELKQLDGLRYIWKSNQWTLFQFPNLTRLSISRCEKLKHVLTSSMVGSLLQLKELDISECYYVEAVIVKDENILVEEESDVKMNEIVLPRLRYLTLDQLPRLKGFSLGKEVLSLPLLDTLIIKCCYKITAFTRGNVSAPELREIETSFGSFYAGEDINSFIKLKQEEFSRRSFYH